MDYKCNKNPGEKNRLMWTQTICPEDKHKLELEQILFAYTED